jgi:hypothetical protein
MERVVGIKEHMDDIHRLHSYQSDLLNRLPANQDVLVPVLLVQEILKNAGSNAEEIEKLFNNIFEIFDRWVVDCQSNRELIPEVDFVRVAPVDYSPWISFAPRARSPMNLCRYLQKIRYGGMDELFEGYGYEKVMGSLVIYMGSMLENTRSRMRMDEAALFAHQVVTDLLVRGYFPKRFIEAGEAYSKLRASIVAEQEDDFGTKFSSKGGAAKSAKEQQLNDYIIQEFNKSHFPTMKAGADAIYKNVLEYDRRVPLNRSKELTFRSLKDRLSKANKAGKLYKKFK